MEDNPLDSLLIQEAFTNFKIGAVLDVVTDGEAAIRFIDALEENETGSCPALVLLDLNLPKRNGTEVLAHLRRSKKCAAARVVIVTSSNSVADRATTQRMGIDGYFLKPSSYEEFLKIGELVQNKLNESPGTR